MRGKQLAMPSRSTSTPAQSNQPPAWLVGTVIAYFVSAAFGLAFAMLMVPHAEKGLPYEEFLEANSNVLFLYTCGMMICCGTIGGSLYDIRGLIKHSTHDDFQPLFTLSYLLRPIAGGLSSLVAFFMLLVGALGFSYSHDPVGGAGWTSFDGRLPFLAVGFLAGYSSQVFMLKLKEIADAAFSSRERENGHGDGHKQDRPRRAA
jgi:hypothetical protein